MTIKIAINNNILQKAILNTRHYYFKPLYECINSVNLQNEQVRQVGKGVLQFPFTSDKKLKYRKLQQLARRYTSSK